MLKSNIFVGFVWISATCAGLWLLQLYESEPGAAPAPLMHWPAFTNVPRDPNKPTMVMFAHPQCPCTRASIEELNSLLAHCADRVAVVVMFVKPRGSKHECVESANWRNAASIPGVAVRCDDEGVEARRFGATTSGSVLLYDVIGQLIFSGGITQARGHVGDNVGRDSIEALLQGRSITKRDTPVLGCALQDKPWTLPTQFTDSMETDQRTDPLAGLRYQNTPNRPSCCQPIVNSTK